MKLFGLSLPVVLLLAFAFYVWFARPHWFWSKINSAFGTQVTAGGQGYETPIGPGL